MGLHWQLYMLVITLTSASTHQILLHSVCNSYCECTLTTDMDLNMDCNDRVVMATNVTWPGHVTLGQARHVHVTMYNASQVDLSEILCEMDFVASLDVKWEVGRLVLEPLCSIDTLETLDLVGPVSGLEAVSVHVNVTDVRLANNGLRRPPADLLHNLCPRVWRLDLHSNNLVNVPLLTASSCASLYLLNLSSNKIHEVPNNTFDGLPLLQILDLSHNLLSELGGFGAESQSAAVAQLDLSHNLIEQLRSGVFDGLHGLKQLDISHNSIRQIEAGVFTCQLGGLHTVDLSHNRLSSLEAGALVDITSLHTLNLSYNLLSLLADRAVIDTHTNSCITHEDLLTHNSSAPENPKVIWENFHTLDLSHNNLSWLGEELLKGPLRGVQVLLLGHNHMSHLPRYGVERLHRLHTLRLSHNKLYWLDVGTFNNENLEVLDISHNKLQKIISMAFLYLPRIRVVDLSHNNLNYIYKYAFYRTCKYDQQFEVSLSHNALEMDTIWRLLSTFRHLEHTTCHLVVDLSHNNVTHFVKDVNKMYNLYVQTRDFRYFAAWNHVNFNLAHNPIRCDCTLYNEVKLLSNIQYAFHENISHADNLDFWQVLNCSNMEGGSIPAVLDKMKCMGSFAGVRCPHACRCHQGDDNDPDLLVVNCTARQLSEVPVLPHSTRIALHLSHNSIFELVDEQYLNNITLLDLSHNALRSLAPRVLQHMPHLSSLYLHGNKLSHVPPTIEGLTNLSHVTLHDNPLACPCQDVWLLEWITNNSRLFADVASVQCESGQPLVDMEPEFFCPDYLTTSSESHSHLLYLGVSGLVALIVVLAGVTSVLVCRRAGSAAPYCHHGCTWYGLLSTSRSRPNTYKHDIFLCYSGDDSSPFVDSLLTGLLDLCPQLRVAPPLSAAGDKVDVRAQVGQSRCTAIVLSPAFVSASWCRHRAAFVDMLQCGAHNLVFVMLQASCSTALSLQQQCPQLLTFLQDYPLLHTHDPRLCATQLLSHVWQSEHTSLAAAWADTHTENTVLVPAEQETEQERY